MESIYIAINLFLYFTLSIWQYLIMIYPDKQRRLPKYLFFVLVKFLVFFDKNTSVYDSSIH